MWLSRADGQDSGDWCLYQATQAKEDHNEVNVMGKYME